MTAVRCHPWRALTALIVLICLSILGLHATGRLEQEHFAINLVGIAEGVLIGLAMLGGVEYVFVRPAVWITRRVQHWRRGNGA